MRRINFDRSITRNQGLPLALTLYSREYSLAVARLSHWNSSIKIINVIQSIFIEAGCLTLYRLFITDLNGGKTMLPTRHWRVEIFGLLWSNLRQTSICSRSISSKVPEFWWIFLPLEVHGFQGRISRKFASYFQLNVGAVKSGWQIDEHRSGAQHTPSEYWSE